MGSGSGPPLVPPGRRKTENELVARAAGLRERRPGPRAQKFMKQAGISHALPLVAGSTCSAIVVLVSRIDAH